MAFVEPVPGEASDFDFASHRSTMSFVPVAALLLDLLSALAIGETWSYSPDTSGDTSPSTSQLTVSGAKEPIPGM